MAVRPPFHRLRRCRALFALALCAWLGLLGMAWAAPGCCAAMPGMTMAAGGSMHGGMPHMPHMPHAPASDCGCAHAPAVLPRMPAAAPGASPVRTVAWPVRSAHAPQPADSPPLRPPAA